MKNNFRDQTDRDLDQMIHQLWQLVEPKRRRAVRLDLSIPLITDHDVKVATAAANAIVEKHTLPRHDVQMLLRANLMQLFHGYLRRWSLRRASTDGVDTPDGQH